MIYRLLLAIVVVGMTVAILSIPAQAQNDDPPDTGPRPGDIGAPPVPLSEKRVYDMANLLSNGQELTVEKDAERLARHGIPNVIVIQTAEMTPEEASAFAADIRRHWGVESGPGADDGLVMLVTAVDSGGQQGIFTTLSWGDHALPHFGVNATSAAEIQRTWLDRYIDAGYLFEGIVFSLRRFIYHAIYDPAPPAPLGGFRATLGSVLTVVAPLLALAAIVLVVFGVRGDTSPYGRVRAAMPWVLAAVALAIFTLAVIGHSGWGVAGALGVLAVAAIAWIRQDPRRPATPQVAS